jgi:hypothetical protein
MANTANGAKRRRRPAQRGVQAVFTTGSNWRGKAQLAIGLITVALGTTSWIYATKGLAEIGIGNLIPYNSSISDVLLPVSIPLLIAGVGLCTYYLAMRRTWRASNRIESALYELETLVGQRNLPLGQPSASETVPSQKIEKDNRSSIVSKALAFVLAQSIVLIILYGGLVQEYASNINMQNWVRANFAPGSYLLNFNAVLILTGLLGILIFQLTPKRLHSKKLQT